MRFNQTYEWHRMIIPTPFPVGPVNVYLVKADPLTLIDTGPNTPVAREAITAALAGVGVTPGDIKRILVTHGHGDHSGLAGWFREMGSQVYVHPKEAGKLTGRDILSDREVLFRQVGVPGALLESLRPLARHTARYNGSLEDYQPIKGGEEIPFDGFTLSVLATSGHTGGHLVFYQRETGVMFAGDTILKDISPNPLPEPEPESPGGRTRSLAEFLATLDRLERVPAQVALPGHGDPLSDHTGRIMEMRDHHRQRVLRLLEELQDFASPYELASRLFGDLVGLDVLLGVSEVCAHLDLMLDRGQITEQVGTDGVVRYITGNQS